MRKGIRCVHRECGKGGTRVRQRRDNEPCSVGVHHDAALCKSSNQNQGQNKPETKSQKQTRIRNQTKHKKGGKQSTKKGRQTKQKGELTTFLSSLPKNESQKTKTKPKKNEKKRRPKKHKSSLESRSTIVSACQSVTCSPPSSAVPPSSRACRVLVPQMPFCNVCECVQTSALFEDSSAKRGRGAH